MSEIIEFPGSYSELIDQRQDLMKDLERLEQRLYDIRSAQPLEGTWDPYVKRQLAALRDEKRRLEARISRLNAQIKKSNVEGASRENAKTDLTDEQIEELRQKRQIFKQAKLRLALSIVHDDPYGFLNRAAHLLSSLATNFERDELTEEEWAVIKVFPEIISQSLKGETN